MDPHGGVACAGLHLPWHLGRANVTSTVVPGKVQGHLCLGCRGASLHPRPLGTGHCGPRSEMLPAAAGQEAWPPRGHRGVTSSFLGPKSCTIRTPLSCSSELLRGRGRAGPQLQGQQVSGHLRRTCPLPPCALPRLLLATTGEPLCGGAGRPQGKQQALRGTGLGLGDYPTGKGSVWPRGVLLGILLSFLQHTQTQLPVTLVTGGIVAPWEKPPFVGTGQWALGPELGEGSFSSPYPGPRLAAHPLLCRWRGAGQAKAPPDCPQETPHSVCSDSWSLPSKWRTWLVGNKEPLCWRLRVGSTCL